MFLFFFLAGLNPGSIAYACGETEVEPRTILALYDGTREPAPRTTRIHAFLEFPLNYLGYQLRYIDVSAGPLPEVIDVDVAATVSWFDGRLVSAADYAAWMIGAAETCGTDFRQIVFGDTGVALDAAADDLRDRYLANVGLRLSGADRMIGDRARIVLADQSMIGLEADYIVRPGLYPGFRATAEARSHLQIAPTTDAASDSVDLVVTAARGAYVSDMAALEYDAGGSGAYWIVDPFAILSATLLPQVTRPIPDVTTLNGRRVFFSTVSADGWLDRTPVREFGQEPSLGAERLRDDLLAPYPDLPTTVAVVQSDLDTSLAGRAAATGKMAAQEAFAMPQVGIASAGRSGINAWGFFASYDRTSEIQSLDVETPVTPTKPEGLVRVAMTNLGAAFSDQGALAFGQKPGAPRRYASALFDLGDEIGAALRDASALGPEGAEASLFIWAGDAKPFGAALAQAQQMGIMAIGGGGGVYNPFAPSLTNLSALSAPVGPYLQVYNALSGDDAYTNYRSTPIYGFQAFGTTLDRTETPRRLKAFQLGYSAGSAIDFGTRHAVQEILDRARTESVIPVTAAQYVAMVQGFASARIVRDGDLGWRIQSRGDLQSLRFDNASGLALDLDRSDGVLGATRKGDVLFVSLMPDNSEPQVRLQRSDAASGMVSAAGLAGLIDSRLVVTAMLRDTCGTQLTVMGWGAGPVTLMLPADLEIPVRITDVGDAAVPLQEGVQRTDEDGRIQIDVPALTGRSAIISLANNC